MPAQDFFEGVRVPKTRRLKLRLACCCYPSTRGLGLRKKVDKEKEFRTWISRASKGAISSSGRKNTKDILKYTSLSPRTSGRSGRKKETFKPQASSKNRERQTASSPIKSSLGWTVVPSADLRSQALGGGLVKGTSHLGDATGPFSSRVGGCGKQFGRRLEYNVRPKAGS